MESKNNSSHYSFFTQLFLIGWVFQWFDSIAQKKGLQGALAWIFKITGANIEIRGFDSKVREILNKHSVVLVSNHPLAPLIACLPQRKDLFILLASEFKYCGPHIAEQIIPIYLGKYQKVRGFSGIAQIEKQLNLTPHFSEEIEHEKNIESIQDAVQKLNNGGSIVISPEGVRKEREGWFGGISYLLKGIEKKEKTYYLHTYIHAKPKLRIFAYIPVCRNILVNYQVTFSKPERVNTVLPSSKDSHEVTDRLEKAYYRWVDSL